VREIRSQIERILIDASVIGRKNNTTLELRHRQKEKESVTG
jgi:hypothetical protein